MSEQSAISSSTAEQIRDFYIPIITAEHKANRVLVKQVLDTQLDFRIGPKEPTLADLMWRIMQTELHALAGICDGAFIPMPGTPAKKDADTLIAAADKAFEELVGRISKLSGDELIRDLRFQDLVQPAVRYLPLYISMVAQFRAQLGLGLRCSWAAEAAENEGPSETVSTEDGELSEKELTAVAGGTGGSTVMVTNVNPNAHSSQMFINVVPGHYQKPPSPNGGLMSAFGWNDPATVKIEGYLVAASMAVVTAGAGFAAGGAAVTGELSAVATSLATEAAANSTTAAAAALTASGSSLVAAGIQGAATTMAGFMAPGIATNLAAGGFVGGINAANKKH